MSKPSEERIFDRNYICVLNVNYDGKKISIDPTYKCPNCGQKPIINETWNCNLNKSLNSIQKLTHVMPCCGISITFNLAVHKEANSDVISVMCTSTDVVISNDWWVGTE